MGYAFHICMHAKPESIFHNTVLVTVLVLTRRLIRWNLYISCLHCGGSRCKKNFLTLLVCHCTTSCSHSLYFPWYFPARWLLSICQALKLIANQTDGPLERVVGEFITFLLSWSTLVGLHAVKAALVSSAVSDGPYWTSWVVWKKYTNSLMENKGVRFLITNKQDADYQTAHPALFFSKTALLWKWRMYSMLLWRILKRFHVLFTLQ